MIKLSKTTFLRELFLSDCVTLQIDRSGVPGEHLIPSLPPGDLRDIGAGQHHSHQLYYTQQHTNTRVG